MKKLKNYLKVGILLFGVILIMTNCEKEDLSDPLTLQQENQKQNSTIISFQKNFTLDNFSDDFIKSNLKVNWDSYFVITNSDLSQIFEFKTNINSTISSNYKNKVFTQINLLAKKIDKNNISFELIKYLSNDKNSLKKINSNSLENFNGIITYYKIDGNITRVKAYENGVLVKEIIKSQITNNISAMEEPIGDTLIPIFIQRYIDTYTNYYGGNTYFYFVSTRYMGTTVEYVYANTGFAQYGTYHEHSDGPHGPPSHPDNHPDEIIIDSTFVGTKAECIYNKLGNSSTGFKNAIKKFDGEFPVAHLKMSVDNNLPDTINAITSNSGTYTIEIKINGNTLPNRTAMGLARTLIHETIHAEMYRKLRSVNYSVSINDFPGIFYYYSTYKNWQHQQMASHYRTTIVDMLKEFDNSQHTDSFYNDLAWEGLQGTVAWNELSSNEKTRIINAINDYKNNGNKNCN